MNYTERLRYYNLLKEVQQKYDDKSKNYAETAAILEQLLEKIELDLNYDKTSLESNSSLISFKFSKQKLISRMANIHFNQFDKNDLDNLVGAISGYIHFNAPTLELFPGTGQFLPYAVAAEPLYIADRFSEVCEYASKSLSNEFYTTRRLRKYKIFPFDLTRLPQRVFDLVYCFNEFFLADIDYIFEYSKCVYNLVHDGGRFVFNFMPIDQEWAIDYPDIIKYTLIDYNKLAKMMKDYGWNIETIKIQPFKSSYIVAVRPGIKQPRAKLTGSIAEIIDLSPENM